jgi:hypothetical protein
MADGGAGALFVLAGVFSSSDLATAADERRG